MKYFVPIDLQTLRKNPNAGNTVTHVNKGITTNFKYKGEKLPSILKDGENCFVESKEYLGKDSILFSGIITDPKVVSEILEKRLFENDYFDFQMKRDVQTIYHLPEREYLYKYVDLLVLCKRTGDLFNISELYTESDDDYIYYHICPCCGIPGCVKKLEYETVEQALLRKEMIENLNKINNASNSSK